MDLRVPEKFIKKVNLKSSVGFTASDMSLVKESYSKVNLVSVAVHLIFLQARKKMQRKT